MESIETHSGIEVVVEPQRELIETTANFPSQETFEELLARYQRVQNHIVEADAAVERIGRERAGFVEQLGRISVSLFNRMPPLLVEAMKEQLGLTTVRAQRAAASVRTRTVSRSTSAKIKAEREETARLLGELGGVGRVKGLQVTAEQYGIATGLNTENARSRLESAVGSQLLVRQKINGRVLYSLRALIGIQTPRE